RTVHCRLGFLSGAVGYALCTNRKTSTALADGTCLAASEFASVLPDLARRGETAGPPLAGLNSPGDLARRSTTGVDCLSGRIHMKRIRLVTAGLLLLLLGAVTPTYAQEKPHDQGAKASKLAPQGKPEGQRQPQHAPGQQQPRKQNGQQQPRAQQPRQA